MKPALLFFLLAILGCGTPEPCVDCAKVTNIPGGAYYAGIIVDGDDCQTLEHPNENIWVDATPQGSNYYNIGFWKFYFKRAELSDHGRLDNYTSASTYFPYLYETVANGEFYDKKVHLEVAFNVYTLDSADRKTYRCAIHFLVDGKKILDYPAL